LRLVAGFLQVGDEVFGFIRGWVSEKLSFVIAGKNDHLTAGLGRGGPERREQAKNIDGVRAFIDHVARDYEHGAAAGPRCAVCEMGGAEERGQTFHVAMRVADCVQDFGSGGTVDDDGSTRAGEQRSEYETSEQKARHESTYLKMVGSIWKQLRLDSRMEGAC